MKPRTPLFASFGADQRRELLALLVELRGGLAKSLEG